MRFERVTISNFKKIDNLAIGFHPKFNLLIGDNGTGKTSVLEALSVSLGAFLSGIQGVRAVHFQKDEISRYSVLVGDGSNDIRYNLPTKVECDVCIDSEHFNFTRQKQTLLASRSTIEPREVVRKAAELSNSEENKILPVISYQSFSRIASQKREKWKDVFSQKDFSRSVGYIDCLDEAANTKMLTQWCARMEQISWQKGKKIGEYESVKNAISKFICNMLELDSVGIEYDKREEELIYVNGTERLPIRLLSSGLRTLIGMIMDIAYRMAVLNPFLKEDATSKTTGVVLIDELDMHLHPKWQKRVVDALTDTFPCVQFICTTHSPFIIQSLKDGLLIPLSNTDEQVDYTSESIEDIAENIMGVENPQFSKEKEEMYRLAQQFYKDLDIVSSKSDLDILDHRLKMLTAKYCGDVAYYAFLEQKLLEKKMSLGE